MPCSEADFEGRDHDALAAATVGIDGGLGYNTTVADRGRASGSLWRIIIEPRTSHWPPFLESRAFASTTRVGR